MPGISIIGNSANIRGQKDTHSSITLIVDGVSGNYLETSHFSVQLETLNVKDIERIEVIPGGGAVLYGSGTSGGVINIITKKYKGTHGNVGYRYGSYANHIFDVGAGTSLGPIDVHIGYSKNKGDGYRRKHNIFDNDYFNGRITYNVNDTDFLSLKYSNYKREGENPKSLSKEDLEKDRRMIKVEKGVYPWGKPYFDPGFSKYKIKREQWNLDYKARIFEKNNLNLSLFH